jgi:hypothetical protein
MSQEQLEQVVAAAGFEVVKPFGIDSDEGLWHAIGFNLTGRWVGEPPTLRLNAFDRTLRRMLPCGQTCHMVGCLAVRPTDNHRPVLGASIVEATQVPGQVAARPPLAEATSEPELAGLGLVD